jgi:hypothetical protein
MLGPSGRCRSDGMPQGAGAGQYRYPHLVMGVQLLCNALGSESHAR